MIKRAGGNTDPRGHIVDGQKRHKRSLSGKRHDGDLTPLQAGLERGKGRERYPIDRTVAGVTPPQLPIEGGGT
jgi:hypothetical protein